MRTFAKQLHLVTAASHIDRKDLISAVNCIRSVAPFQRSSTPPGRHDDALLLPADAVDEEAAVDDCCN